ncbi:hypothetical protein ACH4GP_10310 [Streptomyces celluloflavus]|uniref:Uncharacterized protein n=1 Tax=Streptomyces celluloflavus TaxID=58344 RepID=A0ABW7RAI7_9ACTN
MPVQVTPGGRDRLIDSHGTRHRLRRAAPRVAAVILPEPGHLLKDQARPRASSSRRRPRSPL